MQINNLTIRPSTASDLEAVLHVERLAFASEVEAELVRNLLLDPTAQPCISLLAFDEGTPAGHILLTKATLEESQAHPSLRILAPLAVIPQMQKMGVGGDLIREAILQAVRQNVELVVVLGHPDYYPRFGFVPAGNLGIQTPYPIPPQNAGAWMVQELRPGLLGNVRGRVRCAQAMDHPEMWRE